MKKILIFIVALVLLVPAIVFVACDVKVEGTYAVSSIVTTINGEEETISKSEYKQLKDKDNKTPNEVLKVSVGNLVFDKVQWTFNDDHSFSYYESEDVAGTWELIDDILRVAFAGTNDTQDFEFSKNKLTYSIEIGGFEMTITLTKTK